MVVAQHSHHVLQQLDEIGGARCIPCPPPPVGQVVASGEGAGVPRTEAATGGGGKALAVVEGGGNLAGCIRAGVSAMHAKQHLMGVRPVQGLLGLGGEGCGVGAQGLGQGGVAVDVGPGGEEGVRRSAGELVLLVGGEGVTGGALDELVDADGLVRGGGGVVDEAEPVQGVHRVPGGNRLRFPGAVLAGSGPVLGEVGEGGPTVEDGVLGPVVKFPSSARRAGPAASGACSRRAGHRPSYWMYLGLCPVRRECVHGVAGQTGI
ncbi:hypothetical protein GCM10011579_082580 [Streptomyces albiflavescens]|uniref:Uncharacterized protein n=1 Tax=Streptomyces albiflavescens TaxID=1623582 RepID=A0A917YDG2_9ACTN|nr:hypothetical protein [Streptomyces albiflavescens]GGN88665.1 hypothetical protein GCM10011579_082580 [Streptomyces albiflavescens]